MSSSVVKQLGTGTFIGLSLVTPLAGNVHMPDVFAEWKPLTTRVVYETKSVSRNYSLLSETPPEEINIRSFKTTTTLSVQINSQGKQKAYPLEEYNHLKEV